MKKSQTGKQINTIYILPGISQSKDSQTTKFGHVKENKMRNICIEKSAQNMVDKLVLDPSLKTLKLRISLHQQS